MKIKRSITLLISAIIGGIYVLYNTRLFGYYAKTIIGTNSISTASLVLAVQLTFVFVASIFTIAAWVKNNRPLALTGWILFIVGIVIITPNTLFILPSIILNCIGYYRIKKNKAANAENNITSTVSVLDKEQ